MGKRLCTILLSALLLACTGGEVTPPTCVTRRAGDLRLCLSEAWREASTEDRSEETIAAYRADRRGQRLSLTVTREVLPHALTQYAYADANHRSVTDLPGYTAISRRDVEIGGSPTPVHSFTAQPDPQADPRTFLQLSVVVGTAGYTVTVSAPLGLDDAALGELHDLLDTVDLVEAGG